MANEPMQSESKEKASPRDVFLQLWVIASLYVSVVAFLMVVFQYINYFFPDIANPYSFSEATVRWAVALLIAIFPTHVYVMRVLQRDYVTTPEKRANKLRKWLLYFTLFLAAVAFIADIATLVYYFLGGELSIRFILKVASVASVAGGVFWYYLSDLKRQSAELPQAASMVAWGSVGVVAVAVIAAFFVTGSPFAAREYKIDDQRVANLQEIQSRILYFWQTKQKLPANLNELRDSISGFAPATDPETGMAYEYTVKDAAALSFELCATFTRPSRKDETNMARPYYPMEQFGNETWQHEAGRQCFARSIDKELYPPLSPSQIKPL